jgi:hypothetical protein
MNLTAHARLNEAITKWLAEESQKGHDGWVYADLADDMTHAARMVYDACMKASLFTEEQVK